VLALQIGAFLASSEIDVSRLAGDPKLYLGAACLVISRVDSSKLEITSMNETHCASDSISQKNAPHVYEIRPHREGRVDLISYVLPFGCACWHSESDSIGDAIAYARLYSRSHDTVIRVYDQAGDVTCTVTFSPESKTLNGLMSGA